MRKYLKNCFSLLFPGALFLSCQTAPTPTLFKDLPAAETGLDFINHISNSEDFNMIDYLYYYDGGGVALGDINNDGLIDIYLVSNEGDNGLYLNQGAMKFLDISETAGVRSPGLWKTGVSMVDINGDGLLDIYLCRLGNYQGVTGKNQLFVNQGDLTFKEEAAAYNLDFTGFSTQAAFFDMDNDGDLDAYLLNHSVHTEQSFGDSSLRLVADSMAGDRLYRNDNNYFTDVTSQSGIYQSQMGYGLGIGLSDINRDGYTDIFIANDFSENDFLYLNNQDGTFGEQYQEMVDYTSLSSMGCDLADFNNDGLVDIITLDMFPEQDQVRKSTVGEDPLEIFQMKQDMGYMPQYKRNMLQLNRGNGTFSDIAMMAGVHATDWSWAPLLADFNNDGWKDLFISNGIKGRPNDLDYLQFINSNAVLNNPNIADSVLFNRMPAGAISNYFFANNQDLTFHNRSREWGVTPGLITQGIAYGDLDNDGDLDLVLNNLDTLALIKENLTIKDNSAHFLTLELVGKAGNSRAIGTKVEVFHGSEYQFFEVFPTRGFKSSVDPRLHLGLGDTDIIDSIRLTWPGGVDTLLIDVEADRTLKITEALAPEMPGHRDNITLSTLFEPVDGETLGVDFRHQENTFIEFNREPLIPHMHSREGPALAVADINMDGWDDFFIGGAKHQQGSIYLQVEGGFMPTEQSALEHDQLMEDVDAGFLDFDKDGDQDLVVVTGGNEFEGESPNRQPRLYLNDGKGNFTKLDGAFEGVYQTGSCLAIHDFDGDGWEDIFLGSLVVPWNYGRSPQSLLLRNEKGLSLVNVSNMLPENGYLGMINDAVWVDLDGSGNKSLVLAGEWMGISILSLNGETFVQKAIPNSSGWWKAIHHLDYDGDGDQDLLAGNLGLNSKLKASIESPLYLYLEDFDRNGTIDGVMTRHAGGKESIFSPRDMLRRQIPSIGSNFSTRKDFSEAPPNEVLGNNFIQAERLSVEELRSGVFINDQDAFEFLPFPNIMQINYIRSFLNTDINLDGSVDIFSAGNLFPAAMHEGRYAADRGSVLAGLPDDHRMLPNEQTGIFLRGDIRQVKLLNFQGNDLIMATRNNSSIMWFKRK